MLVFPLLLPLFPVILRICIGLGSWDLPVFLDLLFLICGQALLVSAFLIIETILAAGTDGALGMLGLLSVLYCVVVLILHPSHLL